MPDTTIASGPTAATPSSTATPTFALTSDVPGSTFECSLDSGAFATCASSYTTPALSDGPHTLDVRATDAAGNVDATPASRAFSVDTVAPETSIGDGPAEGSSTPDITPTFALVSSEDGASFECSLDGGAFAGCPASYTTPELAVGPHSLQVRATDAAGNADATPAARSFQVAATAPPAADHTKPNVSLSGVHSKIKLRKFRRRVSGKVTTDEPATLEIELRATPKRGVSVARFELALGSRSLGLGGGTRSFTVKPRRRLIGKSRKFSVQLRVTATDAAGNAAVVSRRIRVR